MLVSNVISVEAYGMVPFINVTLGTMLPMLGLSKQDNYKWVFSYSKYFFIQ